MTPPSISLSVIIPNYNSGMALAHCLDALEHSRNMQEECIVVDDASTDGSADAAIRKGVSLLRTGRRSGPAYARNLGAAIAKGDILVFLDADVCVHPDTIKRITARLAGDPELAALIGSYDDNPSAQDFLSQYRNLLHCFTHQTGNPRASTFWSGCGAMRRAVFLAEGGFDTRYSQPGIEDVELGYRLRAAGWRIALDREVVVRHLKQWSLLSMVRTDVFHRGVPWTRLILQSQFMPNDLNLTWPQRISVMACSVSAAAAALSAAYPGKAALACFVCIFLTTLIGVLNFPFFRFLLARRGVRFAFGALPVHLLFLLYSGCSFVIGAVLQTLDSVTSHLPGPREGKPASVIEIQLKPGGEP